MHVDGFRFDLAAVFAIDVDQQEKGKTPIIHEIETDPVLSRIKLIAEPWSIRQYRLGLVLRPPLGRVERQVPRRRPPVGQGRRRVAGELARRVAGSYDLFGNDPENEGRSPFHSINFVTCHDGFTLNDLVSYNEKHNIRNGENNQRRRQRQR